MGSDGKKKEEVEGEETDQEMGMSDSEGGSRVSGQQSGVSCYTTEDEEEGGHIQLGPKCSIREHLEKDKDDESLRRWKEQLLGSVDAVAVEEQVSNFHILQKKDLEQILEKIFEAQEPDVKIISLTILAEGRSDIVLQIPEDGNPKGLWFTLKEGSTYRLRFSIKVSNEIVCGLKYTNTVWKSGIKVDSTKQMLGTFSPQAEAYTHEMDEETTPAGIFARGTYSARTKFIDDDKKCYLEINYTFDIQKSWPKES